MRYDMMTRRILRQTDEDYEYNDNNEEEEEDEEK